MFKRENGAQSLSEIQDIPLSLDDNTLVLKKSVGQNKIDRIIIVYKTCRYLNICR